MTSRSALTAVQLDRARGVPVGDAVAPDAGYELGTAPYDGTSG